MYLSKALLYLFKEIIFSFVAKWFLDGLPLVDSDNNRPPLLNDFANECKIIDHEGGKCVHHIHYHMALLHMNHCADLHFS